MFSYGVDIFFTRVTPSDSFDLLSDEFDYLLLSLSLLVIFVAILVVGARVRQKELKAAWK